MHALMMPKLSDFLSVCTCRQWQNQKHVVGKKGLQRVDCLTPALMSYIVDRHTCEHCAILGFDVLWPPNFIPREVKGLSDLLLRLEVSKLSCYCCGLREVAIQPCLLTPQIWVDKLQHHNSKQHHKAKP